MTTLSEQEITVLMIAEKGESIAAIAAWEKPIEALVAKGLMKQNDKFNNFITDAGRQALKENDQAEDAMIGRMINAAGRMQLAQTQMIDSVNTAADEIVKAMRSAMAGTGHSKEVAFENVLKLVKQRIQEILK